MTDEEWHPGSFTKNFGWGREAHDLSELHRVIRIGFDGAVKDVRREEFRRRVEEAGKNFFVPANFFLFNYVDDGASCIAADELVFQAIEFGHSADFDRLALFSFNLSLVGKWVGAKSYQSRPAMWSNKYIVERLASVHGWNTERVNADDIEYFLKNDHRYTGKTTRKLSTNLSFLYDSGRLREIVENEVENWWANAAFLAADRACLAGRVRRLSETSVLEGLLELQFEELSGKKTIAKSYALKRLMELFVAVGGVGRFGRSLRATLEGRVNDPRPFGLVDRMLPRAPKALPPGSINPLAFSEKSYDSVPFDEIMSYDVDSMVRETALRGIRRIQELSIEPSMTSVELMKRLRE